MASPYYIEPVNILPGLQMLGEGLNRRAEMARQNAARAEEAENMKLAEEAIKSGDPDAVNAAMLKNPKLAPIFQTMMGVKDKQDLERETDTIMRILSEPDPTAKANIIIEEAEKAKEAGEDIKPFVDMGIMATRGDVKAIDGKLALMLAATNPKAYDAYKLQKEAEKGPKLNISQERADFERAVEEGSFKGTWPDYVKTMAGLKRAPVAPQKPKDTRTTNERDFDRAVNDPKYAAWLARKDDAKRTALVERQKFSNTSGLRKEFVAQSKDFQEVRSAKTRLDASAKNPSPAGDLAIIFNYMKMLDPGSVVRESEFAVAAKAGSYGERIQAAAGRVLSGKRLSPEMRKDFLTKANDLYSASLKQHAKRKESYGRIAKKNNLPLDEVIVDVESFSDEPGPKPSPAGKEQPGTKFDRLPNPASLRGETIRDDKTGTLLKSDGKRWVKVK